MLNSPEKSDTELKKDVLAELEFEPSVTVTDIGVLVRDGVVTLLGSTTSYGAKWTAVQATKRVAGVKAISDEIEVKLWDSNRHEDADIAAAAKHQIEWSTMVPRDVVEVTVREGWITLEGQVELWYQKDAAEKAVLYMSGIQGVINLISIKPRLTSTEIATVIQSAFERSALVDANRIQIETSGTKVALDGRV